MVVRKMCRQFQLPVEILAHETVRESDGLAMSSRNRYLSQVEREKAPELYACLQAVRAQLVAGHTDLLAIEAEAVKQLEQKGWDVDYLSLRRQSDLLSPTSDQIAQGEPLVALGAARLGQTRLIDNLEI